MDVGFATNKLRKVCNDWKERVRTFGEPTAKKLGQRLREFTAAATLEVLRTLPAARCHELAGDRRGCLAVDLDDPRRLVFEPANNPVPRKPDGGLDWSKVTAVRVLEVTDYHG